MAVAFSGHALAFTPRFYAIRTPPSPLKTLNNYSLPPLPKLRQHFDCKFDLGFRISSPITRQSFAAALKVAETEPKTVDGEDDQIGEERPNGEVVNRKSRSTFKSLFEAYQEAILDGDGKAVSDLEAMILGAENEKNDLVQKVAELSLEITSGKEKFIRIKADFENFRKRLENDRLTLTSDVQGDFIDSLLPMVDNFERAKKQIKPETEKEKKIDASYQGIYKQFVEIMRSLQVAVVETVGKPFDPLLHEAIGREESTEFKEGIVIEEFRRGFVIGSRLLRPAMVKVSAGQGSKKAAATPKKSTQQTMPSADLDAGSESNGGC